MSTASSVGPNDPTHPRYARYRAICERIVNVRSAGLPHELTNRDRRILMRLIAQRDALWGPLTEERTAEAKPVAARPTTAPSRRRRRPAVVHTKATRRRPLAARIEFQCERCRKRCWTTGRPKKFCDACSDAFRGRKPGARRTTSEPKRQWIREFPSGIPGSGLRHG